MIAGYKLKKEDATTEKSVVLSEILGKTKLTEPKEAPSVSPSTTERSKSIQDLFVKSAVDISALLPPGYKPGKYNIAKLFRVHIQAAAYNFYCSV